MTNESDKPTGHLVHDPSQDPTGPEPVRLPPAKIVLDKLLSGLLLVLTLPVSLLIVAAELLDAALTPEDRGPLLHNEMRVSQGKPFKLHKFRIIKVAALRRDLEERGLTPKEVENAPCNLTRVGKILKKTGLDELPQLVNVLLGDMSLVGPRPKPVPEYEAEVSRGIYRRKVIRAGLTGPVQVMKGTERTGDEELAADDAYIAVHRTGSTRRVLATDLAILARTVKVLLKMPGE